MRVARMGDHEFSAWLAARGALNNYEVHETHNEWRGPTGQVVAIVVYNNAMGTRVIIINEG